jgi:hypothetical protein
VHLPELHALILSRVALEGYLRGCWRAVLNDRTKRRQEKQTPDRLIARRTSSLSRYGDEQAGLRLKLTHAQRDALVDDASGDSLDATQQLPTVRAAWAEARHSETRNWLSAGADWSGWISITAERPEDFSAL